MLYLAFIVSCQIDELSSLRSQLVGIMECWNIGILGFRIMG